MVFNLLNSGYFSRNALALQHLLAASPTWQYHCDVDTLATEILRIEGAQAFIHTPEASDREGDEDPRPRAVVLSSQFDRSRVGQGTWRNTGVAFLSIEIDTPDEFLGDPKSSYAYFISQLDLILGDMEERSGLTAPTGYPYLNMTGWHQIDGPAPAIDDNENALNFYGVMLAIDWV